MSSLANDPSARKFSFELENVSSLSAALLDRGREANLNPSHHIVEISLIFSTFNIIAASSLESHQKSLSSAPFHPFPRLISHYFPTITHHGANICSGVGGFTEKTTEEENFHVSRSLWESFCHISWAASSWREQCESSQRSKRGKTLLVTCESLRVAFRGIATALKNVFALALLLFQRVFVCRIFIRADRVKKWWKISPFSSPHPG